MEAAAYAEFRDLEARHWWFLGRWAIFSELLERRVFPDVPKNPDCLDVGCGMGGALERLAAAGGTVTGTDVSLDALRWCRGRGFPRVLHADGTNMPFKDGSFDVVTAFDTIEHIPDDLAAFRECLRVLRPGGKFVLSGPAYEWLWTHQDDVVHHQRRYTTSRVADVARRAGFIVEHRSYFNVTLFPIILGVLGLVKLKERLFPPGANDQSSNVSIPVPGPANALLARLLAAERHLVSRVSMPFGHSLILIARKPPAP